MNKHTPGRNGQSLSSLRMARAYDLKMRAYRAFVRADFATAAKLNRILETFKAIHGIVYC